MPVFKLLVFKVGTEQSVAAFRRAAVGQATGIGIFAEVLDQRQGGEPLSITFGQLPGEMRQPQKDG